MYGYSFTTERKQMLKGEATDPGSRRKLKPGLKHFAWNTQ